MKILIVDDEPLIREVIKEYCALENYEVLEAENGIEALEKALKMLLSVFRISFNFIKNTITVFIFIYFSI